MFCELLWHLMYESYDEIMRKNDKSIDLETPQE